MEWYEIVLGTILFLASVAIIIFVMLQQSRQEGLSGAIAGGAETFFGKNKGRTMEAKLAKFTKITAVIFCLVGLFATLLFMFI